MGVDQIEGDTRWPVITKRGQLKASGHLNQANTQTHSTQKRQWQVPLARQILTMHLKLSQDHDISTPHIKCLCKKGWCLLSYGDDEQWKRKRTKLNVHFFEKRDLTDTFCAKYIYLKQSYNSKSWVAKFREFPGFSIFRQLPGIFVGCEVVHLTLGKFSGKNSRL